MQRFVSCCLNQPVRRKRVKYEGSLKNRAVPRDFATIRQGDHFAGGVRAMRDSLELLGFAMTTRCLAATSRRHESRKLRPIRFREVRRYGLNQRQQTAAPREDIAV
jgi:hypothetical protein